MKSSFIVSQHSFVDLITNSSSEIFICNTKKSCEMVKDVLKRLLNAHNDLRETPNFYSFDECFGEVSAAKYSFDLGSFPSALVRAYNSYQEYRCNSNDPPHPSSYYKAKAKEELLDKNHPLHRTKWPIYEDRTPEDSDRYEKAWRDHRDKLDTIWSEYGQESICVKGDLFEQFLIVNNFKLDEISLFKDLNKKISQEYLEKSRGKHGHCNYDMNELPENILDAWNFFQECLSWKFRVYKGDILVRSTGDNTIPYGLFDVITEYLNARRYHLG